LRYIWILFNTVVWTTLLGFIGIVVSVFEPRRGRTLGYCANLWAKLILFFGGVSYSVKGLEFLKPNGSYIFAGNHASGFDILLAFAGLPYWVVSIAKIELKSIPVLGWVMRAAGHIFVDRGCQEQSLKSLNIARQSLKIMPRSVLLFPEGTRTKDGSLGEFKRGGLTLGIETEISIVPVAFVNTFEMLEKGSWKMKNHPIELRLSKPIPPGTYSNETRRQLATHVRNEVQQLLKQN
jgi:1-acyl-sn-glycerol-3-phosphate acyltransferase